jgi:hypothetical protein
MPIDYCPFLLFVGFMMDRVALGLDIFVVERVAAGQVFCCFCRSTNIPYSLFSFITDTTRPDQSKLSFKESTEIYVGY